MANKYFLAPDVVCQTRSAKRVWSYFQRTLPDFGVHIILTKIELVAHGAWQLTYDVCRDDGGVVRADQVKTYTSYETKGFSDD